MNLMCDYYLNGKGYQTYDRESFNHHMNKYPYTFIIGKRGIGKGVLGLQLSKYNKNHLYIESQMLAVIPKYILKDATNVLEIRNINDKAMKCYLSGGGLND